MQQAIEHRALKGTLAGSLSFVLVFVQSILLVPLFLSQWGDEKYGVFVGVLAFVSLSHFLTTGYHNYVCTEFNRLYHTDKAAAKRLLGSALRIAFILGVIELLFVASISFTPAIYSVIGTTPDRTNPVDIIGGTLCLMMAWVIAQNLGSIVARIIHATGRYARSVYFQIVGQILQISTLALAASMKLTILSALLLYSLQIVAYSALVVWDVRRRMPDFYPWWQEGSVIEGFHVVKRSIFISLSAFSDLFSVHGITLIVASSLGAIAVPIWSTIRTLTNVAIQFNAHLVNPMIPELTRLHAVKEGQRTASVLQAVWFITGIVASFPFVLLAPWFDAIHKTWTRGRLEFDRAVFCLLVACVCLQVFGRVYVLLLYSVNHVRSQFAIAIVRAATMIAVGGAAIQYYGLAGMAVGLVFAEAVGCVIARYYASSVLTAQDAKLPLAVESLALSSVAVVTIGTWLPASFPMWSGLLVVGSTFLLGVVYFLQWRLLDPNVRQRMLAAFMRATARHSVVDTRTVNQ